MFTFTPGSVGVFADSNLTGSIQGLGRHVVALCNSPSGSASIIESGPVQQRADRPVVYRKWTPVNRFLSAIVTWLRAGYPDGVPQNDYLPLLALLSGQLSSDEVRSVARELLTRTDLDDADIGAEILRLTNELPSPADIERVRERLAAKGWPLDDPRDVSDARDTP
ncbi:hypothetical protein BH11ACT6_BH11ACT6_14030 [soil metagenome]